MHLDDSLRCFAAAGPNGIFHGHPGREALKISF